MNYYSRRQDNGRLNNPKERPRFCSRSNHNPLFVDIKHNWSTDSNGSLVYIQLLVSRKEGLRMSHGLIVTSRPQYVPVVGVSAFYPRSQEWGGSQGHAHTLKLKLLIHLGNINRSSESGSSVPHALPSPLADSSHTVLAAIL